MKVLKLLLITVIVVFIAAYIFNHFNPWLGIGLFIVYLYYSIKKL